MTRSQILAHIEKPVNYTLFDVQWIPSSARLIAMGSHPRGTGIWQVYQMSKGELKLLEEVSFFCLVEKFWTKNIFNLFSLPWNCYGSYSYPNQL